MDTLEGAIEATQRAVEVLEEVLTEEILEYFTEPFSRNTQKAARRILEIGPLLYSSPQDALHISLWESLFVMHPEIKNDEEYERSLFRAGAWELTQLISTATTWDEFEVLVRGEIPEPDRASASSRVVPIH